MLKLEGKFFLGSWRACEPKANNVNHSRGFSVPPLNYRYRFPFFFFFFCKANTRSSCSHRLGSVPLKLCRPYHGYDKDQTFSSASVLCLSSAINAPNNLPNIHYGYVR